jgi:hypothetical protein
VLLQICAAAPKIVMPRVIRHKNFGGIECLKTHIRSNMGDIGYHSLHILKQCVYDKVKFYNTYTTSYPTLIITFHFMKPFFTSLPLEEMRADTAMA